MSDHRPENCRDRLREEGKAYPKSSCVACGRGVRDGLWECPHEKRPRSRRQRDLLLATTREILAIVQITDQAGREVERLAKAAITECEEDEA